jgi:hypothetical protein
MRARASVLNSSRVASLVPAQLPCPAALAREMQHAHTHHADGADTHTTQRATEWRHGTRRCKTHELNCGVGVVPGRANWSNTLSRVDDVWWWTTRTQNRKSWFRWKVVYSVGGLERYDELDRIPRAGMATKLVMEEGTSVDGLVKTSGTVGLCGFSNRRPETKWKRRIVLDGKLQERSVGKL